MIYLVAGARPNFMKIAPIIRELQQRTTDFDFRLIHTGQHYDNEMSGIFFKELNIPEPDYHLEVGGGTHAEQTAKIMIQFERICMESRPDVVLVVGDVNSTLACAIVTKKLQICLAHVEAGLRSGDRSMPEEINRLVTDSIADLFFITEQSAEEHLINEGHITTKIHFVGHVMIDNLFYQLQRLQKGGLDLKDSTVIKNQFTSYAIATMHRPANVDTKQCLSKVVDVLNSTAEKIPLIFPIHPRTKRNLDRFKLILDATVIQVDPLSYMNFLNLFKDARFVLTDSGGIQEETTALDIPCITLRNTTERPITVKEGTNILAPLNVEFVSKQIDIILHGGGKQGIVPKFWDGQASSRIVDVLANNNNV